jgi:hypothetical protein
VVSAADLLRSLISVFQTGIPLKTRNLSVIKKDCSFLSRTLLHGVGLVLKYSQRCRAVYKKATDSLH